MLSVCVCVPLVACVLICASVYIYILLVITKLYARITGLTLIKKLLNFHGSHILFFIYIIIIK